MDLKLRHTDFICFSPYETHNSTTRICKSVIKMSCIRWKSNLRVLDEVSKTRKFIMANEVRNIKVWVANQAIPFQKLLFFSNIIQIKMQLFFVVTLNQNIYFYRKIWTLHFLPIDWMFPVVPVSRLKINKNVFLSNFKRYYNNLIMWLKSQIIIYTFANSYRPFVLKQIKQYLILWPYRCYWCFSLEYIYYRLIDILVNLSMSCCGADIASRISLIQNFFYFIIFFFLDGGNFKK